MDTRSGFITNIPEEIEEIPKDNREELTEEEYNKLKEILEADRVRHLEHMRARERASKLSPADKDRVFAKARARKKAADKSRKRNRPA